ncbi:hypothetical protein GCM10010193_34710 [Kitasatospora atroaurantiaca]|uniref:Uncharacterized protein n=1 Tax=Kitasatospora atroaurantiaca TaxID=285545 RepID=A0A561ENZ2_9ACTN|nr:hypothetical protein [Kitasatospora atroaurantiaca]TWE17322.1 hypothetical protein FB465_2334 [Kitasatospora atroaurantiaca]
MEQQRPAEGCLVGVVRGVALVVVVPLRFLWELLVIVLRPVGVALEWAGRMLGKLLYGLLVWPLAVLWRYVLAPVGRVLIVIPLSRLYREILTPVGRGLLVVLTALVKGLAWLVEYLVLVPLYTLWRHVLAPVGRALLWLLRHLLVIPLVRLWRTLLYPVLREIGRAIAWAWRIGGRIWRFLVVRPCRWVRREVWWPVKAEVRRVLREVRRALLG